MASKTKSGFSLIELMVVISIISVVATVALPSFDLIKIKTAQAEGKLNVKALYSTGVAWCEQTLTESSGDNCLDPSTQLLYVYGTWGLSDDCIPNPMGFATTNCHTGRYYYMAYQTPAGFKAVATSRYLLLPDDSYSNAGNANGPPTRNCKDTTGFGFVVYYYDEWAMDVNGLNEVRNAAKNCF